MARCQRACRRRASAGSPRGSCRPPSLVAMAEPGAERRGLLRQYRLELRDSVRPEAERGARDRQRGDDVPGRPVHGRGERREAGLELVDGGGERVVADTLELFLALRAVDDGGGGGAAQAAGRELGGAVGDEDLADRGG